MNYFYVEPEVSGGLGSKTIMDTLVHPPRIDKLNYQFDSWLGDELIETFPCYLVTKRLGGLLTSSGVTGFSLDSVLITKSDEFNDDLNLPDFAWLKVKGVPMKDDIGFSDDFRLVVSEEVLNIFSKVKIDNADIEKVK